MNYKKGQFLDKYKAYKCIVCDAKYAVFAKVTTHEGDEALDCEDILVYSNALKEKIPTPIEKILTLKIEKMSDFKSRLQKEKEELLIKIRKLVEFTGTGAFVNIEKEQQELLLIQLDTMKTYKRILQMRLRLLNTEK